MRRKEFICEVCEPPCIIRASEETEAPKTCPFGKKEAKWRERKDEEKGKLVSWKITWYRHFKREELAEASIPTEIIERLREEMNLHPVVLVALGITLILFRGMLREVVSKEEEKGGDMR